MMMFQNMFGLQIKGFIATFSENFSFLTLDIEPLECFIDSEKRPLNNQSVSYDTVCRTAPVMPGLINLCLH